MKIEVKPAAHYKAPSYPDMEKAALNPDLLKKLPERWRYNKAIITAILAFSTLSLTGCDRIEELGRTAGDVQIPVFITEEDALSIIKNEALKYGVKLENTLNVTSINTDSDCVEYDSSKVSDRVLAIDILDNEKEIAVAYYEHGENRLYYEKSPEKGFPYSIGFLNYPYQKVSELEYKINQDSTVESKQQTIEKEVKALIEEDLRTQVKDFIEWLRGQGVL